MGNPPDSLWELFQQQGAEDIGWWATNKPRVEQQLALGMLGPMSRIAGSIQPVAIVDDVSALGDTNGSWHFFGAYIGPLANFTPCLEIHAPASALVTVLVYRVFGNIRFSASSDMIIKILTPSPTTDLAEISLSATELNDGWSAYFQTHQCRVFAGYIPEVSLVNLCATGTVRDAGGAVMQMVGGTGQGGDFHMFGTPLVIPRGRNLVFSQDKGAGVPQGNCYTWGVILREIRAPGGPT